MSGFARRVCFMAAALCLVSCAETAAPPVVEDPEPLEITSSRTTLKADGLTTATIAVTALVPVKLTTTRGTFAASTTTTQQLPAGGGTATLVSCNSQLGAACAGLVRVSALAEDGGVGSISITFEQMEICNNTVDDNGDDKKDCADPECVGGVCTLAKPAVGTGVCSETGACVCSTGLTEICTDGTDNNCDSKVDCAESTCVGKACRTSSGAGGICAGTTCTCAAKEICNNGTDDTCDGEVDCDDPDCQPVGNALGGICDARGNTCAPVLAGKSLCNACSGNGGTKEVNETLCGDGKDNDCDGKVDCQDDDCGGRLCNNGKRCVLASLTCECLGGTVESACDDTQDNDCDGKTDCQDDDCKPASGTAATCKPFGQQCTSAGACACSGNGGTAQATETSCGDGFDNDCDGLIDCQDPNCRPAGATAGKDCSNLLASPPTSGKVCDLAGQCACPGGQRVETLCSDGSDNDCDGLSDCLDSDCGGRQCGANGRTCSGTLCSCSTGLTSEESCSDSRDDDCDGAVDCADSDCNLAQCSTISSNYVCAGGTCKDSSTTFSLVVTAAPTRIASNSVATSAISALLKDGAVVQGARTVFFTVEPVGAGTVSPASSTTNGSGIATATFTSSASGIDATVRARYNTGTTDIYGAAVVTQPRVGQVRFVSQQYSTMGVRYSSYNESNQITFQVIDTGNTPYPAGLDVVFTHTQAGGSYIGAPGNCTGGVCTYTGQTNATGNVTVTLYSGTVASVVSVQASATGGAGTASTSAGNIAIVGAKASGLNISIECDPKNLSALFEQDCTVSNYSGTDNKITCVGTFADRFNNRLARPTVVTFATEAGGAPGTPSQTGVDGSATGVILASGYKLPVDVSPQPGEFSSTYDSGCGSRVHNPRDGLVTLTVSASGEEGFVDGSNGFPANGVYDLGEDFIDIAEPFVDVNDNGTRDTTPFEPYVDTNSNGVWNGPNGTWDDNTIIWAQTRVLYSDIPMVRYVSGLSAASRFVSAGAVGSVPTPTADPSFSVHSAETTEAAASTQSFYVYFADRFFNPAAKATKYTVATNTGTVTARYLSTPETALNSLGMNFTRLYCSDQAGTANCSSTCDSSPCYVVTKIDGFELGRFGTVEIKGGAKPDGAASVRADATLNLVKSSVYIFGTSD